MLGYNRLSVPCADSRRARRAVAASVSATRTSSGIVSAMEAIRVLGRVEMSVFCPIFGVIVVKHRITYPKPNPDRAARAAGTLPEDGTD